MTPDLYDAEGKMIPERRHQGRREDDLSDEARHGVLFWAKLMLLHRIKIVAVVIALVGPTGYMAGCGARVNEFDAVKRDVSVLKEEVRDVKDEVVVVKSGQRMQRYIACVSVPTDAPKIAQQLCADIIREGP